MNKEHDFAGQAKMTLVGLPNKVTTEPVTITKDTTEAVFHLKTDAKSPPGETKSLFCQVLVMQDGEPIQHNLGSGRLRIDAPLARKKPARFRLQPTGSSRAISSPSKSIPTSHSVASRSSGSRAGKKLKAAMLLGDPTDLPEDGGAPKLASFIRVRFLAMEGGCS